MFNPVFLKSASQAADFPDDIGREVGVVGRSNSGKSSAINTVVGARKLARVSKIPGRTQLINFFELAPQRRVVDLPGYGFARVPENVRRRWRGLIESYFTGRQSLIGLMITIDIRRGLVELDRTMLEKAFEHDVPSAVLLTKADKLSRSAALSRLHAIRQEIASDTGLILFSAPKKIGVQEARVQLQDWLDLA